MIKKILKVIFIINVMLIMAMINVHAIDISDVQDIESIEFGYCSYNLFKEYDYVRVGPYIMTDDKVIKRLIHNLKCIPKIGRAGEPTDMDEVELSIKYSGGNEHIIRFYSSIVVELRKDTNKEYIEDWRKAYFTDKEYFYKICDFIESLGFDKYDYSNNVSEEPSEWAEEKVKESIDLDLVPEWNQIGYTDNIIRSEVCHLVKALLVKFDADNKEDLSRVDRWEVFDDTNERDIIGIYRQGIFDGKAKRKFAPHDSITREEYAKVLSNTYDILFPDNITAANSLKYADNEQISDWAKGYVSKVTGLKLMQGMEDGKFNPNGSITKEQVIVTLLRLYNMKEAENMRIEIKAEN